eukprot:CAMPEP_0204378468 /NCGR_PEP_ID=MMETSP0469-20131031/51806_1 /ASSEMBLY_ACC=CAM_ASM_000384 /TAXON_ID=2969 /ORGANISM="Oxyrrhis marina" /LENGTH=425 /DNA_ID=CAMNT_0051369753 /DNA_START=15 /DNA_END=1292 /DNA_ORIENTATION=+
MPGLTSLANRPVKFRGPSSMTVSGWGDLGLNKERMEALERRRKRMSQRQAGLYVTAAGQQVEAAPQPENSAPKPEQRRPSVDRAVKWGDEDQAKPLPSPKAPQTKVSWAMTKIEPHAPEPAQTIHPIFAPPPRRDKDQRPPHQQWLRKRGCVAVPQHEEPVKSLQPREWGTSWHPEARGQKMVQSLTVQRRQATTPKIVAGRTPSTSRELTSECSVDQAAWSGVGSVFSHNGGDVEFASAVRGRSSLAKQALSGSEQRMRETLQAAARANEKRQDARLVEQGCVEHTKFLYQPLLEGTEAAPALGAWATLDHDQLRLIFKCVLTTTGFGDGLFSSQELDRSLGPERMKWDFARRLVDCVQFAVQSDLSFISATGIGQQGSTDAHLLLEALFHAATEPEVRERWGSAVAEAHARQDSRNAAGAALN